MPFPFLPKAQATAANGGADGSGGNLSGSAAADGPPKKKPRMATVAAAEPRAGEAASASGVETPAIEQKMPDKLSIFHCLLYADAPKAWVAWSESEQNRQAAWLEGKCLIELKELNIRNKEKYLEVFAGVAGFSFEVVFEDGVRRRYGQGRRRCLLSASSAEHFDVLETEMVPDKGSS